MLDYFIAFKIFIFFCAPFILNNFAECMGVSCVNIFNIKLMSHVISHNISIAIGDSYSWLFHKIKFGYLNLTHQKQKVNLKSVIGMNY